jgi:hypothetical protein
MNVREATFALRIVKRKQGTAAIVYRRSLKAGGAERLTRIASIGPLAFSAGGTLLRSSIQGGRVGRLTPGPFHPLDADAGARVACYALLASGLRDPSALHKAAENLKRADGTEAAWWLGLMSGGKRTRAIRALRILVEAVR